MPSILDDLELNGPVYVEGGDLHRLTDEERVLLIGATSSVRERPTIQIRGSAPALSEIP